MLPRAVLRDGVLQEVPPPAEGRAQTEGALAPGMCCLHFSQILSADGP